MEKVHKSAMQRHHDPNSLNTTSKKRKSQINVTCRNSSKKTKLIPCEISKGQVNFKQSHKKPLGYELGEVGSNNQDWGKKLNLSCKIKHFEMGNHSINENQDPGRNVLHGEVKCFDKNHSFLDGMECVDVITMRNKIESDSKLCEKVGKKVTTDDQTTENRSNKYKKRGNMKDKLKQICVKGSNLIQSHANVGALKDREMCAMFEKTTGIELKSLKIVVHPISSRGECQRKITSKKDNIIAVNKGKPKQNSDIENISDLLSYSMTTGEQTPHQKKHSHQEDTCKREINCMVSNFLVDENMPVTNDSKSEVHVTEKTGDINADNNTEQFSNVNLDNHNEIKHTSVDAVNLPKLKQNLFTALQQLIKITLFKLRILIKQTDQTRPTLMSIQEQKCKIITQYDNQLRDIFPMLIETEKVARQQNEDIGPNFLRAGISAIIEKVSRTLIDIYPSSKHNSINNGQCKTYTFTCGIEVLRNIQNKLVEMRFTNVNIDESINQFIIEREKKEEQRKEAEIKLINMSLNELYHLGTVNRFNQLVSSIDKTVIKDTNICATLNVVRSIRVMCDQELMGCIVSGLNDCNPFRPYLIYLIQKLGNFEKLHETELYFIRALKEALIFRDKVIKHNEPSVNSNSSDKNNSDELRHKSRKSFKIKDLQQLDTSLAISPAPIELCHQTQSQENQTEYVTKSRKKLDNMCQNLGRKEKCLQNINTFGDIAQTTNLVEHIDHCKQTHQDIPTTSKEMVRQEYELQIANPRLLSQIVIDALKVDEQLVNDIEKTVDVRRGKLISDLLSDRVICPLHNAQTLGHLDGQKNHNYSEDESSWFSNQETVINQIVSHMQHSDSKQAQVVENNKSIGGLMISSLESMNDTHILHYSINENFDTECKSDKNIEIKMEPLDTVVIESNIVKGELIDENIDTYQCQNTSESVNFESTDDKFIHGQFVNEVRTPSQSNSVSTNCNTDQSWRQYTKNVDPSYTPRPVTQNLKSPTRQLIAPQDNLSSFLMLQQMHSGLSRCSLGQKVLILPKPTADVSQEVINQLSPSQVSHIGMQKNFTVLLQNDSSSKQQQNSSKSTLSKQTKQIVPSTSSATFTLYPFKQHNDAGHSITLLHKHGSLSFPNVYPCHSLQSDTSRLLHANSSLVGVPISSSETVVTTLQPNLVSEITMLDTQSFNCPLTASRNNIPTYGVPVMKSEIPGLESDTETESLKDIKKGAEIKNEPDVVTGIDAEHTLNPHILNVFSMANCNTNVDTNLPGLSRNIMENPWTGGRKIVSNKDLKNREKNGESSNLVETFECFECFRVFDSERGLVYHNHTNCHPCWVCGEQFPKHDDVSKHFNTKHIYNNQITTPDMHFKMHPRRVTCGACSDDVGFSKALLLHLQSHMKVTSHQCKCCICYFASDSQQVKHQTFHKYGEKDGPYRCAICWQYFWFKFLLVSHHKSVHSEEMLVFQSMSKRSKVGIQVCDVKQDFTKMKGEDLERFLNALEESSWFGMRNKTDSSTQLFSRLNTQRNELKIMKFQLEKELGNKEIQSETQKAECDSNIEVKPYKEEMPCNEENMQQEVSFEVMKENIDELQGYEEMDDYEETD